MSNEGKKVRAHYRGTLDDGTQFDSSYDRGEPLEFTCCAHQMIPGFDAAVKDMEVGEKKTVHIPCAEAYGERREDLVMFFPAAQVPNIDQIHVGDKLALSGAGGQPVPVTVVEVTPEGVKSVSVNFMTQKLTLEAEDNEFDEVLDRVVEFTAEAEPDCEIIL